MRGGQFRDNAPSVVFKGFHRVLPLLWQIKGAPPIGVDCTKGFLGLHIMHSVTSKLLDSISAELKGSLVERG